jgi:hypothetical protein
MSNVLPGEVRARLERRVWLRYITVVALMCAVSGFVALLTLLPAYVTVYVPKRALEESTRELRSLEAQANGDRMVVAQTRALMAELTAVPVEPKITPLIRAVLAEKSDAITITSIAHRPGSLVLVGTVTDRRDLEAYRERLAAMETFESVSVPVAALVGALSGSFTITLTGSI